MKLLFVTLTSLMLAMTTTSAKAEVISLTTVEVDGESYTRPWLPVDLREVQRGMEILAAYTAAEEVWSVCQAAELQLDEAKQSFDTAQAATMAAEIDDLDFTPMNEALVAVRSAQTERDSVCQQVVEPTEQFEALAADWNDMQSKRRQAASELQSQVAATAELAADNDTKIGMVRKDIKRLEAAFKKLQDVDAATTAWCVNNRTTTLCRARDEGH